MIQVETCGGGLSPEDGEVQLGFCDNFNFWIIFELLFFECKARGDKATFPSWLWVEATCGCLSNFQKLFQIYQMELAELIKPPQLKHFEIEHFPKWRNSLNLSVSHKSSGRRLWENCMCDINFLIPLPFKPDKERFIKRQEFRVEFSGLRSLLHSPGEEEEEEGWDWWGGPQHLFQQIEPLAKKRPLLRTAQIMSHIFAQCCLFTKVPNPFVPSMSTSQAFKQPLISSN